MKIRGYRKQSRSAVSIFSKLRVGDVFYYGRKIYIKIETMWPLWSLNPGNEHNPPELLCDKCNAVRLGNINEGSVPWGEDGNFSFFKSDTKITLCRKAVIYLDGQEKP